MRSRLLWKGVLPRRRVGQRVMINFRGIDDGEDSSQQKHKQENLHDLKLAATTTTVFVSCRKIDDTKWFHHIRSACTTFAVSPESSLAYCFTAIKLKQPTHKPLDDLFSSNLEYCMYNERLIYCAYMEAERRRLESPPVAAVAALAAGVLAI